MDPQHYGFLDQDPQKFPGGGEYFNQSFIKRFFLSKHKCHLLKKIGINKRGKKNKKILRILYPFENSVKFKEMFNVHGLDPDQDLFLIGWVQDRVRWILSTAFWLLIIIIIKRLDQMG